ncbi:MAG: MetQ/NlpA family ABC transporter substrate-binding protein [Erysipelotrichales bacterium]
MKKLLGLGLGLLLLVGCGGAKDDATKLSVSATSVPHAEILEQIKPQLKEENIDLEIVVVDDYFIPNKAVANGDVDANFFQHIPFLNEQIKDHKYKIENAGNIHIEPIGIYSKTYKNKSEIKDGATVVLSNSVADHGRILSILEKAGLIELDKKVDKINAKVKDIVKNKKNLVFKADVDPAFAAKAYENNEGDLVAINGNFALNAGIKPLEEAIILEDSENNPYVNIVVTQEGKKDDENIKKLVAALKSEDTQKFILDKYKGSVIIAK